MKCNTICDCDNSQLSAQYTSKDRLIQTRYFFKKSIINVTWTITMIQIKQHLRQQLLTPTQYSSGRTPVSAI